MANPHVVQLLCCAAEEYHVAYLSPVLALLWLFSKVPSNRSIMIKKGVVGTAAARLSRYADAGKKKGVTKRKGSAEKMEAGEQSLCALTMLAAICFG